MSPAMNYRNELERMNVRNLVTDSRKVQRGDTFVAYPGESGDGRNYIAQAIANGANAVIWDTHHFAWNEAWDIPNLGIAALRDQAGYLADQVYGAPSERLWMVGVTGTNGKTSTCHWISRALNDAGRKCALIGTLGNGFAGNLQATRNTTPDSIRVHGLLADYLAQGADAVAMEVSSHALAQGRVNGVRFDVALLTNLSRDHLDYHGDMESYAASKRRLFDWHALKHAVINLDDAYGVELAMRLKERDAEIIGYGMSDEALRLAEKQGWRMVYGNLQQMSAAGMRLRIHSSWGRGEISSCLVGRFNAANLLGAAAVLLASGIEFERALQSLGEVPPVAGRMQKIGDAGMPAVFVDYAHTPDALEKVLLTLREAGNGQGRLICVFGCGGDRDRGKRAMMGRIAEKFSDHCIVTSDNPRSEDAAAIIDEVMSGMASANHEAIADRKAAIERAIFTAQEGDTVLVAGKGHEDYQEIAGIRHRFSDAQISLDALRQWRGDR